MKRTLFAISMAVICMVSYLDAAPVHSLNLEKATAQADLIVIGEVLSINEEGRGSFEMAGGTMAAGTRFRAMVKVDRVLKGELESQSLAVEFFITEHPAGLKEVDPGQYSIFFLKKDLSGWVFFDPTNPDLPAAPGGALTSGSALDRVTAAVAQVLASPSSTERDRFRALDALGRLRTDFAKDLLRQSLDKSFGRLRLDIARTLVARGDVAGLKDVEDALQRPSGLPENVVASLAGSLRGLKDPITVPSLSRLSTSNDTRVRLGAAVALRQTGSPAAIRPLSRLLSDSNSEVLYYAVVGLGEITHQDEWTPAMDEFKKRPAHYLAYWREWGSSNSN